MGESHSALTAASLAERTLRLVRIASPIGAEKALADEVEQWALSRFSRAEVLRVSHSLVVGNRADTRPTVALIGHLDTVPAHPEGNAARLEGDRLFGLGASDMKGSLAVMMALAEALPLQRLPVNLLWVFYEREEGPFQESGLGPLFSHAPELLKAKFGIAMEPTDGAVQVGCVGSLHARLVFRGQAAHSARPWQGQNAIHAAGELLAELNALARREVQVAGFTYFEVLSATLASGGHARNVVPATFELNVNSRFAPGVSVVEAERRLRDFVRGRCEVSVVDVAPSGRVCADNAMFQALVKASGVAAQAKQAWTDVARFSELGVDAVNFGPGETAQAHQHHESCSIAALQRSALTLQRFFSDASLR